MTAPVAEPSAGGRRAQTKAHNRAAIIAAARVVFAELGYDAAGVRDVIRHTDLASGTFYNYFEDKEAVFRAVVDESAQEIRTRLRAVRARARTLEEFVGDAYRVLFRFLVEDRLLFELLQRNAGPIRALFGESVLGAGVVELFEDLRSAIGRGDLPRSTPSTWPARWRASRSSSAFGWRIATHPMPTVRRGLRPSCSSAGSSGSARDWLARLSAVGAGG